MIRRLRCPKCCKLHVELPACLVPHKHYDAEVISGVIDGVVTPNDQDSEDYPCSMTMRRWIRWFFENRPNIEGLLRHAFRRAAKSLPVPESGSLLSFLREHTVSWLEAVLCFIYNSGEALSAGSS